MYSHHRSGVTLIELGIVLAVISVLVATALPGFRGWTAGFDVKDTSRAVADSFALARAEAIRTGNNHIVAINGTTIGATNPIEVANDGAPGTENCLIDAGETVHVVKSIPNVEWGTTSTLANGTAAPDDMGGSSGTIEDGWSFTDAGGVTSAQWVVFQADGIPHLFTPGGCVVGPAGAGGGTIYLTNGERDYAVVLGALGTTRIHLWLASGWRQ